MVARNSKSRNSERRKIGHRGLLWGRGIAADSRFPPRSSRGFLRRSPSILRGDYDFTARCPSKAPRRSHGSYSPPDRRSSTVVPFPNSDLIRIRPPHNSTDSLACVNPSPEPPAFPTVKPRSLTARTPFRSREYPKTARDSGPPPPSARKTESTRPDAPIAQTPSNPLPRESRSGTASSRPD